MSVREALGLLALFVVQFHPYFHTYEGLLIYSGIYIALALVLLVVHRKRIRPLLRAAKRHADPSQDP